MTKNLDLDGGTVLTPALSDVPNNYTLPTSSTNFTGAIDNKNAAGVVYNSNSTDCSANECFSYYSWTAATAGTSSNITATVNNSVNTLYAWMLVFIYYAITFY